MTQKKPLRGVRSGVLICGLLYLLALHVVHLSFVTEEEPAVF